ncbi:hypothetical protein CRE_26799 [Caenorhabditis remanei]|uniref:DUF281 domain-containing protein n=1 Tax=Caenorhabditis remanei TaxID=31234 RepID=E3NGB1_CAERE|nr:hypothetical protein CRE_26799 [Caenorhabditis remanei]
MILILLFLSFPTVVENCLVVKTVEPPKCECQSLDLSTSNILSIIGNHEFYKSNISKYSIHAPKISIDDCNAQMYCEGVYSLVVFDSIEKYHVFGAYSADGLCDPFTQKWLVDDGSATLTTYGKMQGVCVDYTTKAYTCPCRLYTVDTENAMDLIGGHPSYWGVWFQYQFIRPILSDEECPTSFSCPKNNTADILIGSSDFGQNKNYQLTCGTDEFNTPVWSARSQVNGESFTTEYIFITCLDYKNKAIPPPFRPSCKCDFTFLTEEETVGYYIQNDLVSMIIGEDRCTVSYGCKRGVALTNIDGEIHRSDRFDAICHQDSEKWTVKQYKSAFGEEKMFENQDRFTYACSTSY